MDIPNAFIGKLEKPTPRELADALGPAIETWNQLVAKLGRLGVVNQEWSSYSPKYGWHLKLKIKKRNILYLGPCNRLVRVSLVLGDRAVKAAHESKLSAKVIALLDKAPKYAEGTGLILLMKGASEIPSVMKLAAIKLAN